MMIVMMIAPLASAGDLELDVQLTRGEFEQLVDHLAGAIDMPGRPAGPLGRTGFDLHVGAYWIDADDDASWWAHSLGGMSDTLGGIGGYRASIRKGLPKGLDVGAQVGSVAGEDFWSAEVRYALLRGGAARPAVGVRGVWSQLAGGPMDLSVFTAQVTASKGFGPFTPYASAGMRWVTADARAHGDDVSVRYDYDSSTFSASAGVHLKMRPLGVRLEVRKATELAAFFGLGVGF
jgi:hypothetical protein